MRSSHQDFFQAVEAFRKILPADRIEENAASLDRYQMNCTGVGKRVPLALYPISKEEIVQIVRVAQQRSLPLFPVSAGKNWGYGSLTPMQNDCIVVNLSRMNRILDFDPESGVVTLQPGVTQRILKQYLSDHHYDFLVPTSGGGPECSILGNALERGFGITPQSDHFSAVMSLEAVLPDGSIYRPLYSELGCPQGDRVFKWGLGPYLDGLFTQSSFGIVTEMTIALSARPESLCAFFFTAQSESDFEKLVVATREIMREAGANLGGINLMNDLRILSMGESCPKESVRTGQAFPKELFKRLAVKRKVGPWSGAGAIYGTKAVVRAVRRLVKKKLRPHVKIMAFLSPGLVRFANHLMGFFPFMKTTFIGENLQRITRSMELFEGEPSLIALPLVNWRSEVNSPQDETIDPDQGDVGLLWYSPICPVKATEARQLVELIQRICPEYGIDPLITLTAFNERCFDCTLPILFNRHHPGETERALACYGKLFEEGRKLGFLPYRTGIQGTQLAVKPASPFWQLQKKIKQAVDPQGIIAPGRYSFEGDQE